MDFSPEQVLDQLKTRGFETGGFRSPLRHFRAKLESITRDMVQRGSMPQPKLEFLYNFIDMNVLDSTEAYPFPIAQINIMHSNRDKSGMGVLGTSMDKIINADIDPNLPADKAKNQGFLIGKIQEWKVTPGHMMWNPDVGQETPRECWEVVYVEGVGGTPYSGVAPPAIITTTAEIIEQTRPASPTVTSPAEQAMKLLDGKTQQEWNNIVFQNPLVKSDGELTSNIIQGTFISQLEAGGLVTKDENGVFHLTTQ